MENQLLSALPREEYERLLPDIEEVKLKHGEVLYEGFAPIEYVYFLDDSVACLVAMLEDGTNIEVGVVGYQGMVGIPVILEAESSPLQAIVQIGGSGKRMKAAVLLKAFRRSGHLQRLLLRYTHALFIQVSQTAACNRLHTVQERLCRWLLTLNDRVSNNEILLTQELLANMLGMHRPDVTAAIGVLQKAGLINHSRGKIVITNRAGMEEAACECYRNIKEEYERLREF